MSRISRKARAELLQALLNPDSGDDDNDLLQEPTVHPLQPSQQSPDFSVQVDTPTKVSIELPVQVPVESKEKFEERGKKRNGWKYLSRMNPSQYQIQIAVTLFYFFSSLLSHPLFLCLLIYSKTTRIRQGESISRGKY
jgi:hypothetical protein